MIQVRYGQNTPSPRPAAIALPTSSHRSKSTGVITFAARIVSGVCALVQIISGGLTCLSLQPVAIRATCRAAFSPSEPAQIITE